MERVWKDGYTCLYYVGGHPGQLHNYMVPADDSATSPSIDPYAVLNVERDAGLECIRAAYKRACIIYHPDKHGSEKKAAAEKIFSQIQTSYSVLTDPVQRDIYDRLGWAGITTGWQLGPRLTGIEDVKRAMENEKRKLFSRPTVCKTNFQALVDASGIEDFLTYETDGEDALILDYMPGVLGMSIGQRFEQVFDGGYVGSVSVDVLSRSGIGLGSLSGSLTKLLSPNSRATLGFGVGSQKYVSGNISKQFTKELTLVCGFNGKIFGGVISPSFQLTMNKMYREKYLLSTSIVTEGGFGSVPKVVLSGHYLSDDRPVSVNFHVADSNIKVDLKHTYKLDEEHSVKVKVSTLKPKLSFTFSKEFSESVKLAVGLEYGDELGTVLKLSFTRFEYHFTIPIIISHGISSFSVMMSMAIPFAIVGTLKTVADVYFRKQEQLYWERYREERKAVIEKKRDDALIAQWLLEDQYNAGCETAKLKIKKAEYRAASYSGSSLEIKIPLQSLVQNDTLSINMDRIPHLIGCYDVAIGSEKQLIVEYEYAGKVSTVMFNDKDLVRLPVKKHF